MKNAFLFVIGILIVIQFIPVDIKNTSTDPKLQIKAPENIMKMLKKSCYDCHSNSANLPWYSKIAPFSFFIKYHIDIGRKWLNFSIWETYTQEEKDKKLKEIYRAVYIAMPLQSYLSIHKNANLTKEQRKLIRQWTGKAPN